MGTELVVELPKALVRVSDPDVKRPDAFEAVMTVLVAPVLVSD